MSIKDFKNMTLRELKKKAMFLLKDIGSPGINATKTRNGKIQEILVLLLAMSNSVIIIVRDRGLIIYVIQDLMFLIITNDWRLNKYMENEAVANFSKLACYTFKGIDPEYDFTETAQKQYVLRLITGLRDNMALFASL